VRKLKKKPLTVSLRECVPLKTEFDRTMLSMGAPDLAALVIDGDLRNGRLRPVVVYISPDKKHMVTWLNPSDSEIWRHVRAVAGDVTSESPVNGYCLVRRVDRDKCYPIAETPTLSTPHPSGHAPPPKTGRRKPGPKITKGWRIRVAAELNRIIEDEKRIPSAAELVEFCGNKLGYYPDESTIQKMLRFLLDD